MLNICATLSGLKQPVWPISPLAINFEPTARTMKVENLNLVVETARSLGAHLSGVNSEQVYGQSEKSTLSLVW